MNDYHSWDSLRPEEKNNDSKRQHYTRFMSVSSGLDARNLDGRTSTMEIDDGYVPNTQYRPVFDGVGTFEVGEGTPRHWEFNDRRGEPSCPKEGFSNRAPAYWNMKEYGATTSSGLKLDYMFPQEAIVPRLPGFMQAELWGQVNYN